MTITFSICNVASDLVKTVMLRKFFQMVFVGNDRRSLNIYTATVLGGNSKDIHVDEKSYSENVIKTKYISELDTLNGFCMKFGFVIKGNDDNDVLSINSDNVTEGDRDFLSQVDCIQQIWGKECKVIYNSQEELKEKYCFFTGKDIPLDDKLQKSLAFLAQNRILWIQDDSKAQEKELCAIAIPGSFSSENYARSKSLDDSLKQNDGDEKAFYRISVPNNDNICNGIELVNWVKTTIRFKHRLHDQNLNFCINKDLIDNTQFIAPDFTWYFSPPVKSFISFESSSAEIRWQKRDKNNGKCILHEACKCPIKPESNILFTSKRYDNVINPVANKTTVNFNRWTKDEMIGYRQKYRIAAKNLFTSPEIFNDARELNIFIDTTDEHNRGNRQYILGIFISFALAFGIDKTRLENAQIFFPLEQLFLADTWWLFMIISLTLNLLIRPVRGIQERKYIYWRTINIGASFLWIFMVFCVDRSRFLTSWFNKTISEPLIHWFESWVTLNLNFFLLPRIIFIILFISNVVYVGWNIRKYHDPIISSLLDEDIL